MLRMSLRGLLARKLRTALTALRRRHRRRVRVGHLHLHRHDQRLVHRPVRARLPRRRRRRDGEAGRRGRLRRPHPAAARRDAREGPGRRRRRGGGGQPRASVSIFDDKGDLVGGNGPADGALLRRRGALRPVHLRRGRPGRDAGRGVDGQGDRRQGRLEGRRRDPRRRPRAGAALQGGRDRQDRRPELAGHRLAHDAALRGAEDRPRARRRSRRSSSPPTAARRRRSSRRGSRRRSATPRWCAPARSRPRRRRATSTTRSASSRSGCWCSPASPCSSAAS